MLLVISVNQREPGFLRSAYVVMRPVVEDGNRASSNADESGCASRGTMATNSGFEDRPDMVAARRARRG